MRTKNNPVERTNHFWCNECDPQSKAEPMTAAQAKEHLQKVHSITDMKGRREMEMCLDGEGFYQNSFTWTIGGVKLSNVSTGPK